MLRELILYLHLIPSTDSGDLPLYVAIDSPSNLDPALLPSRYNTGVRNLHPPGKTGDPAHETIHKYNFSVIKKIT